MNKLLPFPSHFYFLHSIFLDMKFLCLFVDLSFDSPLIRSGNCTEAAPCLTVLFSILCTAGERLLSSGPLFPQATLPCSYRILSNHEDTASVLRTFLHQGCRLPLLPGMERLDGESTSALVGGMGPILLHPPGVRLQGLPGPGRDRQQG